MVANGFATGENFVARTSMTLRQLQIFVTVATLLNVSEASEKLRIAQPAISHHLRLLQDEFGQHLYHKVGSGIALTPAGELFLREAKVILSHIESLRNKLSKVSRSTTLRSLTVGGSYSPSAVLLPWVLASFKKQHPEVKLRLRTDDRIAIERMVAKGEVDLAVLHNPPSHRLLTMELYRDEPMVAFVAPTHPLAEKKRLQVQDFREVGLIVRKLQGAKSGGRHYLQVISAQGFTTNIVMQCDSPEAVKTGRGPRNGRGHSL
jgi:DNA-binding transcriptional LysR family regulator